MSALPAQPVSYRQLHVPFDRRSRISRLKFQIVSYLASFIATQTVQGVLKGELLRFRPVETERDWKEICGFRLSGYEKTIPYMLDVLDQWGQDLFDEHSFVFGIWKDEMPVATIRYTSWPFEVCQYLSPSVHFELLYGPQTATTVEFSRLLVAPDCSLNRLMPALITYSGIVMMFCSPFRRYVGYAKKTVVRKLSGFACNTDEISFSIPERGRHTYEFVFGSFVSEAKQLLSRAIRPSRVALVLQVILPKE